MKKFKQTKESKLITIFIFSYIYGFIVGYCTVHFKEQTFNAIFASVITLFIGWLTLTIQSENKEIAKRKLLLDGYKEKELIENTLKEQMELFNDQFFKIKLFGTMGEEGDEEIIYQISSYEEFLIIVENLEKIYNKYIFLLKIFKINTVKISLIFNNIKAKSETIKQQLIKGFHPNLIDKNSYLQLKYIDTGLKRLNQEIDSIVFEIEGY